MDQILFEGTDASFYLSDDLLTLKPLPNGIFKLPKVLKDLKIATNMISGDIFHYQGNNINNGYLILKIYNSLGEEFTLNIYFNPSQSNEALSFKNSILEVNNQNLDMKKPA